MDIAVIGAGNVGGALGRNWARSAHRIIYGVRDVQADKVRELVQATGAGAAAARVGEAVGIAGAVVLATPWAATQEALREAGDLTGKILVDCTNPLRFTPGLGLELMLGFSDSGAEQVARWAPGARVVKAFNTYGWENFLDADYPAGGNLQPLMLMAGDDPSAKATVAALARDAGFEPFDAGMLRAARELEPIALLWIRRAMTGARNPNFVWAMLRR